MTADNGDVVVVHYTGTLDDGTEFDSSIGREPLEFVLGQGMLIPGFETAVRGKKAGDSVTVCIPPEEAYGERNMEMVLIVPREVIPQGITPEVGMQLRLDIADGEVDVVVSDVSFSEVELDGNHPLAGKSLTFEINIVDIRKN